MRREFRIKFWKILLFIGEVEQDELGKMRRGRCLWQEEINKQKNKFECIKYYREVR